MAEGKGGGGGMASIDPQTILDAAGGPPPNSLFSRSTADQADALARLAEYLTAHPDLPPIHSISTHRIPTHVALTAQSWAENDTAAVAAWALAGAVPVQVRPFVDLARAHISAVVTIAPGFVLEVWSAVPVRQPVEEPVAGLLRDAMETEGTAGGES